MTIAIGAKRGVFATENHGMPRKERPTVQ